MTLRSLLVLAGALAASALTAQEPIVGTPGAEEFVGSLAFYHPSIATDSKGQPHFVCDPGGNNQFAKFHKVNGTWSGGVFAVGSNGGTYDASRLYIGQIEIDREDRAWISCKFGTKEYGSMLGYGVWLFGSVANNAYPAQLFFKYLDAKGHGAISTDAKYPDVGVGMATGGNYDKLDLAGNVIGTGTINAGPGGEKMRFRIASYAPRFPEGALGSYPDGIWHTAMNGFSSFASAYQNSARYNAGLGPVTWADYSTYPQQGADYSHTGLGIDLGNPRAAYMGCVFGSKLAINIWDGDKLLFPANNLKVLDYGAAYEQRHTIQFAPAPSYVGGTFVVWSSGGRIKLCYLSRKGVAGTVRDISAGTSPAACSDRYGNVHIVYSNNGIRYRKVPIQAVVPLAPSGRVTQTRRPLFHWAGTPGATTYTIELSQDGTVFPAFAVSAGVSNNWTPSSNLTVGAYSWRIKEGTGNAKPWSSRVAFVIPPELPVPVAPIGQSDIQPVIPTFSWTCEDPAATRFNLRLYKGADLLGDLSLNSTNGSPFSEDWTNNLTAGTYSWSLRSVRPKPDFSVASDWTEPVGFQLGVPGELAVTNPVQDQAFAPGLTHLDIGWSASTGAVEYTLKVLKNGVNVAVISNNLFTAGFLNGSFSPAYYTLVVRGVNGVGNGPWSQPVTFRVKRAMMPDGTITNRAPASFRWTRSEPATRYLLKILQFDAESGKYLEKREAWIPQTTNALIRWTPPYIIPNGNFRWSITDYDGSKRGYTQTATFQIWKSGHSGWNNPALIQGRWKVLTSWRWSELDFLADGVIRTIQPDGASFTRARWSADGDILTMVSDVTERCPYTVTENTLTFKLPSGNVKELVRIK